MAFSCVLGDIGVGTISSWVPISIENYKIVVLRQMSSEAEMPGAKAYQLLTWSIIAELLRSLFLTVEHKVEKIFTMASSLHTFVNVKIKDTNWLNFSNTATI